VALEAIRGEVTFDELAIKYSVSKSLISNWRKELLERGKEVFNSGKRKEEAPQESKLYQKIGELNMEVDFLKKFLGAHGLI